MVFVDNNVLLLLMPVKTAIPFDNGHFFITFTCYKWLPLISLSDGYHLVYKWFDVLKSKGHFITGFVIMPNHIHATIAFSKTSKPINKIIGDGKRFIGYGIVDILKKRNLIEVLQQLKIGVSNNDKKRGKLHEIWQDSFDWKFCIGDLFTWQKIDYIHENPCAGKWMLAASAVDYCHSSAKFYITGVQGEYSVLNFKNLHDMNLTVSYHSK